MNVLLVTKTYTDGSVKISSTPIPDNISVTDFLFKLERERAARKLLSFTIDIIEGGDQQ